MKRAPYVSKTELIEFLKLGVIATEAEEMANNTPEKDWGKRLKTASTHLSKIVDERLKCLDLKQLQSVARRRKHTVMRLFTSDEARIGDRREPIGVPLETVTMEVEDLQILAELALCACQSCPQGECVKDCIYREKLHILSVPVARDEVEEGQCEFRADDEAHFEPPQRYDMKRELI